MSKTFLTVAAVVLSVSLISHPAAAQNRDQLNIYWVDSEGGGSTLIVAPSGESVLIDAGWVNDDRDAKRIAAAAQEAGLKKIDYFVLTHYHPDHAGGLPALAKMIPIEHCIDHGDEIEETNRRWYDVYMSICRSKRKSVKAGDRIPIKGLQVDIVASEGGFIARPINGGGPNPLCASAEHKGPDDPENWRMVGTFVTYGKFTFVDLGDLNWERELELSCPVNKLGQVTLYQTTRHGSLDGAGAPPHLYALRPQVVVANNGPRKGLGGVVAGMPKMGKHYERLAASPGIEGIWQVHKTLLEPGNTSDDMIANLGENAEDNGHWLRATVTRDGTLTMTNGRTGMSKSYMVR
jgi:beta-lactamase superfamily II metal-dependent hydrolase